MSLLEATDVTVRFATHDAAGRRRFLAAVAGVSLSLAEGERLGIVGESGSGKTTLGKALLALEVIAEGAVRFRGQDVHALRGAALLAFRRGAQMVFQDPMGALNPRMKIGTALEEVLAVHHLVPQTGRQAQVRALLDQVGLNSDYAGRYPHEFSGGQRQRVGIARALALNPALIVADEPVSALDVSVQAQILNLLKHISEARNMACILIAHDLAVINYVCQKAMVMYLGRVVEAGPSAEVFGHPLHPYTQALKAAVPDPDLDASLTVVDDLVLDVASSVTYPGGRRCPDRRLTALGTAPSTLGYSGSSGCGFAPRCPKACAQCRLEQPSLRDVGEGRKVACHGHFSPLT